MRPISPVVSDEFAAAPLRETVAAVRHVGAILSAAAAAYPEVVAVAEAPRQPGRGRSYYRQMTFAQLDAWATQIAAGLQRHGVPVGTRLALLVPPGIDFVALVFGLMKAGMVSILIDPGMGKRHLIGCLSEAKPQGFVGIAKAQLLRIGLRGRFAEATMNFGVGCRWPGLPSIHAFRTLDPATFVPPEIGLESIASCIFTSGSTGAPKGVEYRHRNFVYQAVEISRYFRLPPAGVDISGFPLFALFNTAMAVTTVFPRMNFTRPAAVDPRRFIASIDDWTATQSFGSPALWNTVSRYCEHHQMRLPSIRHVLTAGAPVPAHLLARCKSIIATEGEIHTPYGATEALPVACITAGEVLTQTAARSADGAGTCVGRPFPEIEWRVIAISDQAIPDIAQAPPLTAGEIGELIVRGPVVTERYVTRTESNSLQKIADRHSVWHRMGDVGYLDRENRFWFCGRLTQRVRTRQGTMFTIPCEAIINGHPSIYRSALVGIGPAGEQIPAIVAEPWPEFWPRTRVARSKLLDEIAAGAQSHRLTQSIRHFYLRRRLPVDIRHNAKIFREQLARWVARQPSFRPAASMRGDKTLDGPK